MDLSTPAGPLDGDLMRSDGRITADGHGADGHGANGHGANGSGPPPPVVLAGPRRRRAFASRRQKVVAAIVILGALGFLLARGLENAMNYYLTANQAVAQRAKLGDSDFRIQGKVMPGVRQVGTKLHFAITAKNVDVDVVSTGSPPQLFRVGMPVVLDGHWQGNVFSSFQIMVQHGATYVEKPSAQAKNAAPST